MAIAQRSFSAAVAQPAARPNRTVRRPAVKPAPIRRPAKQAQASVAPLLRPMLAATALATVLVTYLSGHAQMASETYQRAVLLRELKQKGAELELLHAQLTEKSKPANVVQWAEAHGLAKPTLPPLSITAPPSVVLNGG